MNGAAAQAREVYADALDRARAAAYDARRDAAERAREVYADALDRAREAS